MPSRVALRDPLTAADLEDLKQRVWDLYTYLVPLDLSVPEQTYSTDNNVAYERVLCDFTGTGTVTITLSSGAPAYKRVQPVKRCSGNISIVGENSETIAGASSLTITASYDAPLLEWSEVGDEWLIR